MPAPARDRARPGLTPPPSEPNPQLMADSPEPEAAVKLFAQMMRDIEGGGGEEGALEKVGFGGWHMGAVLGRELGRV